jgi:hypothetical protein
MTTIKLSGIVRLFFVMLTLVVECHYVESQYDKCCYADLCNANCHCQVFFMQNVVMLSVIG